MSDKTVIRNSIFGMMKHGRFRAIRNLPVGWITQSIHSTDTTERYLRLIFELILISIVVFVLVKSGIVNSVFNLLMTIMIIHTITWLFFGNFWVYMLDSFNWVGNGGIDKVLSYTNLVKNVYSKHDVCDAVLIYGSMSRSMLHDRSDLDLRVIRRTDSNIGYLAIIYAFFLKAHAFFIRMPVDFQVVDSLGFLQKQMRADEKPIIVYLRDKVVIDNAGILIDTIFSNPKLVLKDNK